MTATTVAEIRRDFFPPLYQKQGKMEIPLNILRCKKNQPKATKEPIVKLGFLIFNTLLVLCDFYSLLLARSNLNIQFSKKTDCILDQNVKDNEREEPGNGHQEWAQVKHPKRPVSEAEAALAAGTLPKGTSVVSGSQALPPLSSPNTESKEEPFCTEQ